jgi:hypothetical protein
MLISDVLLFGNLALANNATRFCEPSQLILKSAYFILVKNVCHAYTVVTICNGIEKMLSIISISTVVQKRKATNQK